MYDPAAGYDLAADFYDDWPWQEFWRANEAPLIKGVLKKIEGRQTALDLGCGTGAYLPSLAQKFARVIGVDPSSRMLRIAQRLAPHAIDLVRGYSRSLPLAAEAIDVCLSARSLSHESAQESAIREVARVLKAGGLWIISDVHAQHRYIRTTIPVLDESVEIETHKIEPKDFLEVATSNGDFRLESLRTFGPKELTWVPIRDAEFQVNFKTLSEPVFFMMVLRRDRGE